MATVSRVAPLEDNFPFDILSHLVPVTPFREYPNAIIDEHKGVWLSVKQYIPRHSASAASNADPVTIIAAGALGFAKEAYEPLFAEVLRSTQRSGVTIRSIWIADMFNVGESAEANRDNLGCDPAWIDHSRDLWSVISHFNQKMIKPIIGLGHSFGCNQLLCLSSWHPSLFHSFAFIEPGIDARYGRGITIPWAFQTLKQNDTYPTRQEAESSVVKLNNARTWDERVLARLKHYSVLRRSASGDWVQTTPKDQIAALVSRFNPGLIGLGPGGIKDVTHAQRELVPDSDPQAHNLGPFYRHELRLAWDMLPSMRPWVLYVNGGKSPFFGYPATREERARLTGTGVGGNGGIDLGAVKQIVIEDGEHSMVFDRNISIVADHVAGWLAAEQQRWINGPKTRRDTWLKMSGEEKRTVGSDFVAALASEMNKMKRVGKL
ncbi:hypothetical protein QQS21_006565 [Conoideocrella luteorostrata]|uniref:AB hydrolase-1 domain-containing protein n=1 Tax=Conoideocrella luteorostrata TaxID=1105319 RepID=A0AAJ0CN72_9HYPO|nr:hypothetical protein QQS21_006565 [Conoideocrella luteorostrata]